jgi:hypothetical protein
LGATKAGSDTAATLPIGDFTAALVGVEVEVPHPARIKDEPMIPADSAAIDRRFMLFLLKLIVWRHHAKFSPCGPSVVHSNDSEIIMVSTWASNIPADSYYLKINLFTALFED